MHRTSLSPVRAARFVAQGRCAPSLARGRLGRQVEGPVAGPVSEGAHLALRLRLARRRAGRTKPLTWYHPQI